MIDYISSSENNKEKIASSTYDNFTIHNHVNLLYVDFIYEINYLKYKKKIFSSINDDIELIFDFFNNEICDILINIFILKKKNKIDNIDFNIFNHIFNFINLIHKIDNIDQEDFLNLIINLYHINLSKKNIIIFFNKFIFKDLVDYNLLIEQINNLYNNLNNKILLFKIFDEIIVNINDKNIIKEKILYLAKILSFDFFMYYDSLKMYNIITNEIINYDKNIIINEIKILQYIFIKYKNLFINEYNLCSKKHYSIYDDDIELKLKFKIKKSVNITKLINNIDYINNL